MRDERTTWIVSEPAEIELGNLGRGKGFRLTVSSSFKTLCRRLLAEGSASSNHDFHESSFVRSSGILPMVLIISSGSSGSSWACE